MSEIRERLKAHRLDVLVLLQEVSHTATLFSGFRLAGAVGHIARAQVLLAEELFGLSGGSEGVETSSSADPAAALEDATPVDGISPPGGRIE
ncbi:MAG TPA: hypothetical protein VGX68_12670 [Thermoanaerobaculia bacterium]|jgi:hypothetical protein|nr:hypothetical protein [Thermoanaerobaculia bacterium]